MLGVCGKLDPSQPERTNLMKQNIGTIDRIIRILVGLGLIGYGITKVPSIDVGDRPVAT